MVQEPAESLPAEFSVELRHCASGCEWHCFHCRRQYALAYAVEGTRRCLIRDAAYEVGAGDVALIGEEQFYKIGAAEEAASQVLVTFSAAFLSQVQQAVPGVPLTALFEAQNPRLLTRLDDAQLQRVQVLFGWLLDSRDDAGPQKPAMQKLLLGALLLYLGELCRRQGRESPGGARPPNRTVEQIQSYVVAHYAEKLTLTDIAARFYISPYYLSRLFKRTIHLSLIEYINGVRIREAQRRMEASAQSVSAVARETGFLTTAHFRRVFKEATGLSPQQYRQRYHQSQTEEKEKEK